MSGKPAGADEPVVLVDTVGLTCPLPVLRTQKALRGLPEGAVVEVRASDPLARIDIPHFCAEHGHALLTQSECGGLLVFRIARGRSFLRPLADQ